jgi:hypothetical protein
MVYPNVAVECTQWTGLWLFHNLLVVDLGLLGQLLFEPVQ